MSVAEQPAERRNTSRTALVLAGCGLLALATFLPVMRWDVNAAHDTAGNARIWFGDDWTLADGGFQGASVLPVSSVAVLALAVVAVFARGRVGWWSTLALAAVAAYVPLWTAVAFARKWEDQVAPDIGAAMLVAGCVALTAGLWLGRPTSDGEQTTAGASAGSDANPATSDSDRHHAGGGGDLS